MPDFSLALAAAAAFRREQGAEILYQFADLLRLANVTGDIPALENNAAALAALLTARGADVRTVQLPGVAPVVVGTLGAPNATRRFGMYVHYDGQPTEDWASDPFDPVLRRGMPEKGGAEIPFPSSGSAVDPETRIYARSAADDKAPLAALLGAVDALAAAGIDRTTELVLLFEGEEESGSTHLGDYMSLLRDELAADLWLICDGPVHPSGRPQVAFGVRGYCGLEVTVYGPERELHSGHFGNWVPNPAHDLARLLATCKDDEGTVLVEGFYDSTAAVTAADETANTALPPVEEQYQADLGFGGPEPPAGSYADHLLRPTFNVRGLRAADTGAGARNVIPSHATASIDIRLAAGNDPNEMLQLVVDHVERGGYQVLERAPTAAERRRYRHLVRIERDPGYPAARTAVDHPAAAVVTAAAEAAGDGGLVRLPTFGGSVPLHHFNTVLGSPVLLLPIANYDNNQHSANENLRVGNLWYGIDLWAALLAAD